MNLEILELTELNKAEALIINGGESGWYWALYFAGGVVATLNNMGSSSSHGDAMYYK